LPVRGPSDLAQKQGLQGAWAITPNQEGSETRSEVQSRLSTQTVFAKAVGFWAAAQPRQKAGEETDTEKINWNGPSYLRLFYSVGLPPSDAAEPKPRIDILARAV